MQIAFRDEKGLPLSRAGDPLTSHLAEQHIRDSGKLNQQQQIVLRYVRRTPGGTAPEYQGSVEYIQDNLYGVRVPEGVFRRRLVELERAGLLRRGEARRSDGMRCKAATWWPIENKEGRSEDQPS